MSKKILSATRAGVTTFCDEDGKTHIETVENVAAHLDMVKRRRGQGTTVHNVLGHHVASISLVNLAGWASSKFNMTLEEVIDDDAMIDLYIKEHGAEKVHKGWE